MNLFNIPSDNMSTMERLHYAISGVLNKSCTECNHPLQLQIILSCALVTQGTSKTSNYTRNKVMKNNRIQ